MLKIIVTLFAFVLMPAVAQAQFTSGSQQVLRQVYFFHLSEVLYPAGVVSGVESPNTEQRYLHFDIPTYPTEPEAARDLRTRMALRTVRIRERGDDPCHVTTRLDTFSRQPYFAAGSAPGPRTHRMEWRECSLSNNRQREGRGDGIVARLPAGYFARSVQVCINNDEVKGIALTGATIACLSGQQRAGCTVPGVDDETALCGGLGASGGPSNWDTQVSVCQTRPSPDGSGSLRGVMVGLELHYQTASNGNREKLTGVRALCRSLERG